jgi:hypothetical protein
MAGNTEIMTEDGEINFSFCMYISFTEYLLPTFHFPDRNIDPLYWLLIYL